MKLTTTRIIFTAFTLITAASCARKDPPVIVEQTPGAPNALLPPAAEPERQSAWRPAPVRSGVQKQTQPRNSVATNDAPPAPVITRPVVKQPSSVTLAEGSIVAVRVNDTLTSEKSEIGQAWSGVLAEPIVINGLVVAEKGATAEGRVTDIKRAGRVKGVAQIGVELTGFTTADGQRVNVQTASFSRLGKDETKKDAGKVAIASGIGAAIGAIAGRSGKGAAVGAGAGAAAGTGVVLATRGGPAIIASESLIRFRVSEPVRITEKR